MTPAWVLQAVESHVGGVDLDELAGLGDDHDVFIRSHDEEHDEAAAFVDELADAPPRCRAAGPR